MTDAPPDRLALVLSGAVSLGSFEAGVLDELLYTLEHLANNGGRRWTIDVITGASAGSMTAALVARALLHDFRLREQLHTAWVERIDIRALTTAIPPAALLCSTPIDEIAHDCIGGPPAGGSRPAIAPETLYLSFTLSNMNGVDFELHANLRQNARFTSTFFAEHRRFALTSASDDVVWDRVRQAAVCSGNFPIAFLPRMMASDPDAVLGMAGLMPAEYCYVDGGLFNNEPIREAVQLAALADDGAVAATRKFLLVDATLNRSIADAAFDETQPLARIAARLVGSILGERGANDWLRAQRVNNEIGWRDTFFTHLVGMVRDTAVGDVDRLIAALDAAGLQVIDDKRAVFPERYPDPRAALLSGLARTREVHAALFDGLGDGRAQVLVRVLFLLNSIAGLQKKTLLDLDMIYAEPGETAGDKLFSFGGFFNREWREHDYRVGRRKALQLLPQILGFSPADVPSERGPHGEDLYMSNGDYTHVTMKDADRRQREILRDSMARKFAALARDYAPGPAFLGFAARPLTSAVVSRIVKKKLGAMLEL
ncbi:MAG: patatin-like phospholipase family protein [Gemmatimonadota bacterium]